MIITDRFYVAAPDATPAQIAMGFGYRTELVAREVAGEWNEKHPACPVIVWRSDRQATVKEYRK